ncbi:carboxylesterase family protein [Propioniciclava soli]|uniref:carboxylesterase family protein n=1 Tax=Propioniciclava soli TaxID=2775081 RepID=UPI001E3F5265|nr:carboxylesterase family protein [Propioniciclava soli]
MDIPPPPAHAPEPSRLDAPVWTTPAGEIRGWTDRGVARATGIPYAKAGRHERPRPVTTLRRPFEATRWSPSCPQVPIKQPSVILPPTLQPQPVSEHCQNLSITLPIDASPSDRLPLMVWIHGGSYTTGAGDISIFDPYPLVMEQRVVVVSVTYRLGMFGYLGAEAWRPANLGLLDQVEALAWVHRNIASFGDNPGNVTLFGQSAGGDSVAHLMIAEGTRGLFQRAVIASAPFGLTLERAAMSAAMAEEASGIDEDSSADEIVAAQAHVEAAARPFGLRAAMPFGVQYGFDPLPAEGERDEAWSDVAHDVDVLVGWTAREVALFTDEVPALRRAGTVPGLGRGVREAAVRSLTEVVYGRGARAFGRRHHRAGGHGYQYVLDWGPPRNPYRAAHTIDLPLLFGDEDAWRGSAILAGSTWRDVDVAGRTVRGIWGDFARTGRLAPRRRPGLITVAALAA